MDSPRPTLPTSVAGSALEQTRKRFFKKPVLRGEAKRSRRTSNYFLLSPFITLTLALFPAIHPAAAQAPAPVPASAPTSHPASAPIAPLHKFKAVDADNHAILINKPGAITLLLGTSEDSQDAARAAGKAMYPVQGRSDFQLVVVVDLRDSIATWVPSVVLGQMRDNLDREAIELKPYYLKNGNKTNPRITSYVIADFNGSICPQLGWTDSSGDLRGILFGADGREIKRWNKIDDMNKLQVDVWAAIAAYDASSLAKAIAASKSQGTKLVQPPTPPPPLPPIPPAPPSN